MKSASFVISQIHCNSCAVLSSKQVSVKAVAHRIFKRRDSAQFTVDSQKHLRAIWLSGGLMVSRGKNVAVLPSWSGPSTCCGEAFKPFSLARSRTQKFRGAEPQVCYRHSKRYREAAGCEVNAKGAVLQRDLYGRTGCSFHPKEGAHELRSRYH